MTRRIFLQLHDSVIVEDATGRLSALRAEVNAHIESAPQKTEAENAQSLSWCRKMLLANGARRRGRLLPAALLLTDSLSIYYDLRGEYYFGPKKALRRMANTAPDDAAVYERALHEPSPENLAAWVGVLKRRFPEIPAVRKKKAPVKMLIIFKRDLPLRWTLV